MTGTEPDTSDFFVPLPVPEATDTYKVFAQLAGVAAAVDLDLPDLLPSDRTQLEFRVVASAPMTAGDQIDFLVVG